ncbi:hypothetical protein SmJEL517_g00299 [Synchytrium microbalum]|uniref:Condensin complex subunit 2 n=1 Tax=Synchytrium microbalum TaxID=1806994 RepID=A0A507CJV4_9FUNG|nr:uncharacterized protein SmJEL517_g00299 [Synchytrium microbalum]TPX38063.1 hypothetical protein SmJEL517_g00299 [Synchytrium microbalum]
MLAGTPKKARTKRVIVSETPTTPDTPQQGRGNASSSATSSTNRPQKNNDEAEKRQRRQSLVEESRRRKSFGPRPPLPPSSRNNTDYDDQPSGPLSTGLSPEEVNKRFEEWMKIAADNKINANNSWNLALIDYFHDLTLLRDGDSINFTKASCTLDGCVKIYTSRVDSVDAETRKLLSGLVDSATELSSRRRADGEVDGDDENENEDGNGQQKKTRKRANRAGRTLETDINQLNVKKFDSEFMVDPLFKKTSADFDEGGARGLLLNHLCISNTGHMIFDASDATVKDVVDPNATITESTMVNLTKLKLKFDVVLTTMWTRDICPSLKTFEFSSDNAALPFDPSKLLPERPKDDELSSQRAKPNDDDDDDDPFAAFDDTQQVGYGDRGGAGDDYMDDDMPMGSDDGMNNQNNNEDQHQQANGNGKRNDNGNAGGDKEEYVQGTLGEKHYVISNETEDDGLFSYFDSTTRRGWAGPEHWKFKSASRAKTEGLGAAATKKRGRKAKEPFVIKFATGTRPNLDELFAPGPTSTTLSKTAWAVTTKTKNLLPDDLHYSSKDLLKLFLKPDCTIKFRRKDGSAKVVTQNKNVNADDAEAQFWADARAENNVENGAGHQPEQLGPFPDDPFGFDDDDDDIDDGMEPMTQINHMMPSDDNMRRYSMAGSTAGDYASQLIEQPKKVKIVPLNYARAAKRVDVRALKQNIWMELVRNPTKRRSSNIFTDPPMITPLGRESTANPTELVPDTRKFSDVVHELSSVYPERKFKDISVAFCFICVLHLANENHLKIEGQESLNDLVIMQG